MQWPFKFLFAVLITLGGLLLFVNAQGLEASSDTAKLSIDVESYLKSSGADYSYYYEDLISGENFSSGNSKKLRTASLFKLPPVMDIYKLAEEGKVNLDGEVTIKKAWLDPQFGDLWRRGEGAKITVREAIKLSLAESDNTASNLLVDLYNTKSDGGSAAAALQARPDEINGKFYISAETYSKYFKCLHSACYISKKNSDTILQLLSSTKFHGLRSLLPSDIKVAHKIGSTEKSYADCGIIYSRSKPYILCVMVKSTETNAINTVADVSKRVFNSIGV